ncbi:hypothetical protein P7G31_02840 [Streptococcus parauberis]|uniref:Uncharacterized protein n=1 Tax=Streptococcus parauberis TaxID=1348 RepID=A0AAE4HUW7_9STRE|nr:hypothetical protein [Streptococcus parauberis]MDT2731192.1 hypothetical protein [Streptococcus parauberis]
MEVIGWHGTTEHAFKKISNSGFQYRKFTPGITPQRYPNDLGNGIYFFIPFGHDNGKIIASAYVSRYKDFIKFSNQTSYKLISCRLVLDDDKILDLNNEINISMINEFKEKYQTKLELVLNTISNNPAKTRALRHKNNFGLIVELFIQYIEFNKPEFIYQAVNKKTYTDLPQLPIIKNNNGHEICIRKIETIKEIGGE